MFQSIIRAPGCPASFQPVFLFLLRQQAKSETVHGDSWTGCRCRCWFIQRDGDVLSPLTVQRDHDSQMLHVAHLGEDPSKAVREPGKNIYQQFAGYSNVLSESVCVSSASLFIYFLIPSGNVGKWRPVYKCFLDQFCVAAKWTAWRFPTFYCDHLYWCQNQSHRYQSLRFTAELPPRL